MLRRFVAVVLLIALVVIGWYVVSSKRSSGPVDVCLWYWHSPFYYSPVETETLKETGIKLLFVRAGTVSTSGTAIEIILPQSWQKSEKLPPGHLVYALDSGIVRHFEDLSNAAIADCIVSSFTRQKREAESAGLKVLGVQVDFDCATRLLPKYADLLSRIRRGLPDKTQLSITSLPTWFTSRDLRDVVGNVDFYCPQFYETQIGKSIADAYPVSDIRMLERGLESARRLGKPFYAGIPAYGHSFMFDDKGRLLGTYRGMSAAEAAQHPSFRLAKSWPADASGKPASDEKDWTGEEFVDFEAIRPGVGGRGLGYHLLYTIPTVRMLALNLDAVREKRPGNCLGTVLFRSPEQDEIMTLPATAIKLAVNRAEAAISVKAKVKVEQEPWSLIEGGQEGSTTSVVTVSITNTGEASSCFADSAARITLRFDVPGVKAELGDYNRITCYSENGLKSGPQRTSEVIFSSSNLRVGQTLSTGPIRVFGGARTMSGEYEIMKPGGFGFIKSRIELVKFQEKESEL